MENLKIEEVIYYKCPSCGRPYQIKQDAEDCSKNDLKKKKSQDRHNAKLAEYDQQSHRFRNLVTLVTDIPALLIADAKERWGAEFTVENFSARFGAASCNYNSKPINSGPEDINASSVMWRGRITGKWNNSGKLKRWSGSDGNFPDMFDDNSNIGNAKNLIRGFHTGTGSGYNNNYSYECYFFLDDFPLLKPTYEEFKSLEAIEIIANKEIDNQDRLVEHEIYNRILTNIKYQQNKQYIKFMTEMIDFSRHQNQSIHDNTEILVNSVKDKLFPIDQDKLIGRNKTRYNQLLKSFDRH